MNRKLLAAFLAVFIAGAAAGSIVTILRVRQTSTEEVQMQAWVKFFEAKLTADLKLSPDQQARLRPMLEATARQLSLKLEMFSKDGLVVMKAFDEQFDTILTDEQRALHRAMKKK
jgi:uncharacterized membrane protein